MSEYKILTKIAHKMSGSGDPKTKPTLTGQHVAIGQASKYLGVSVDTVRRWERSGKLTAHRLDGKNRHFLISDLEQYKQQKQLSTLEVAAMLKVSESTVRRLERNGSLVPQRTETGKRLYSPLSVSNYIAAQVAEPPRPTAVMPVKPVVKPVIKPPKAISVIAAKPVTKAKRSFSSTRFQRKYGGFAFTGAIMALFVLMAVAIPLHHVDNGEGSKLSLNTVAANGSKTAKLSASDLKTVATLNLPSTFFVQLPDSGLTVNITNQAVEGTAVGSANNPYNKTQIENGSIGNAQLAKGGIAFDNLSPEVRALISGVSNAPLAAAASVTNQFITNVTQTTGNSVSVVAGLGLSGALNNNTLTLNLNPGTSTEIVNNNLEVRLASGSGLEQTGQGLQLLGSCSGGQVLQWTGSAWACSTVASGSSTLGVEENGAAVSPNATAINFVGNDFVVTDNAGQATVGIDYGNSGLTRATANETITGNWSFKDSGFTIADDVDATKKANFQVSGITAGTTRTLTVPDVNGTLITSGNLSNITSVGTITSGTWQGSAVGVQYGGTGAASFTTGGIVYGNGTGALQATAAGTGGQLLIANGGGTPTFVGLSGDIALSSAGVATIGAGKVTNGNLVNSSLTVTAGTGLNGGGSVTLGGSTSLSVAYGLLAGTAAQGNTALTFNGSGNLTGLLGGTAGGGFTTTSLDVVSNPSFTTSVTTPVLTNAGALNISTTGSGNDLTLSSAGSIILSGFDCTTFANGGLLTVSAAGILQCSNDDSTLANTATGNLTASGTITLSGLGLGLVHSSAGGVLSSSAVDRNSSSFFTTALTTANGGTGVNTFATNGILYGNGTGTLQATAAGTSGQVLLSNGGVPVFTSLSGDVTVNNTGVVTIGAAKVTNGNLVNSSLTVTAGTGLSGGGAVALGGSTSLSVVYGATTSTAAQGNTSLSFTGAGNLTGTVSGTAGGGLTTNTLNTKNNPSFTTSVTTPSLTNGGPLSVSTTGASNDLTLNSAGQIILTGFNCTTFDNGGALTVSAAGILSCSNDDGGAAGTITGSGTTNRLPLYSGAGSLADSWLLQNTNTLQIDSGRNLELIAGDLTLTSGDAHITGNLTSTGSVTFTGLSNGVVHASSGVLSTSAVVLGSDTSGNYVANLGAVTGLSTGSNTGAGSTPSLAVLYGATASTAVQGNTQISVNAGTGLSGGTAFTLGSGGTTTLNLDINGLTAKTSVNSNDYIALYDATSSSIKKISRSDLLQGITGALLYQGTWNASTNTPTLSDASGTNGYIYAVSVAGTRDLGSGSISYGAGDFLIHNGTKWQVAPSASTVTSVLGRVGSVVAQSGDYNALQVTNTPTGGIAATTVQAALNELDSEKLSSLNGLTTTSQTFANDTNVTITSAGSTHTLGWSGTLSVDRGGTGAGTFTSNGVIFGSGTGAFRVSNAGTGGQILLANGSGTPTFTSLSGDITVNATGVTAIGTGKVTNPQLANSSLTVTAGTGLTGGGSVSLGGSSTALNVTYGATTNTAAQGNSAIGFTGAGNLTGTVSGTAGGGFTTNTLALVSSPVLAGTLTVQGATATLGTSAQPGSLVLNAGNTFAGTLSVGGTLGQATAYTLPDPGQATATICLSTGNCTAVGMAGGDLTGTYPNPTIGVSKITNTNLAAGAFGNITGTGALSSGSIASGFGTISTGNMIATTGALQGGSLSVASGSFSVNSSGAITAATGITSSGTITLSGLNSAGIVRNSAAGVLSTGAVALGTDTTGAYVANLGTVTGLSTGANTGAGSTPSLAVLYGATASTAVQGNVTVTCPSGSGNLTGGGTSITLGTGGTCGAITTNAAVSFGTSVTTPIVTSSAGLAVTGGTTLALRSTGANTVSLDTGGAAGITIAGANASAVTIGNVTSNPTISFAGSGTFGTTTGNVSLNGNTTIATGKTLTVTNGLSSLTGGLTVSGTTTLSSLNSVGVLHTDGSGVLSTSAIALGTDTSGNYVAGLGALTGLSASASSGVGISPTLSVIYGSSANQAAQGNTALSFTGAGNLAGSLSGTAGGGFTTTTLDVVSNPSFSGLITGQASTTGLKLSGTPVAGTGATSLLQLGATSITGGNSSANGGTYIGINTPASGNPGFAADFLNFQVNGAYKLKVTNAGLLDTVGGVAINGSPVITSGAVLQNVTASTSILTSGTLGNVRGGTGLDTSGAANGQLLIGNGSGLALGTLANNGGLTISNTAGGIGLAVNYGATSITAARGDTGLSFTGSGNLTGTVSGTSGGGLTTNTLALINNPSFTTSVTTPSLTSTAGLTIDTTGAAGITIAGANANNVIIGNTTSNPTISFTGSGTFGTTTGNVSLNGNTSVATGKTLTVVNGLTSLTGGATIVGITGINTTGTANTSIGNSTGSLALAGPTSLTGTLGVSSLASLNGGATVTGLTTANGNILVQRTGAASALMLDMTDGKIGSLKAGSAKVAFFFDDTGSFSISRETRTNIAAGNTPGTDVLTALGSGNVGIGDTTPLATLTVGEGDLFQVAGATGTITTAGSAIIGTNLNVTGASTLADLSVTTLRVGTSTTAGYILTADASGNATWQAPKIKSVYNGTTLTSGNNIIWTGSVSTTTGVGTIILSTDGTTGGPAIYSNLYTVQITSQGSTGTTTTYYGAVTSYTAGTKTLLIRLVYAGGATAAPSAAPNGTLAYVTVIGN